MAVDPRIKNLATHLEKIAYGTAGVVALVIFLIPFMATSDLRGKHSELEEGKRLVKKRIDEEKPTPPPIPEVEAILTKEWEVSHSSPGPWAPSWTMEVRPAVLQIGPGERDIYVKHDPGKILKITPSRDAKELQVYLRLECQCGEIENAALKSAKILRREVSNPEGEGAPFAEVKAFGAGEEIKLDDSDVEAGKSYEYKLVTDVEPLGDAKLKEEDRVKESIVLPLGNPVPYEYLIRIISATDFDPATGESSNLTGEISYWDYEQGKLETPKQTNWSENNTFGPKLKSGEPRYRIRRIQAGKVTVQDRKPLDLPTETLTVLDNKRPVELPPEVTFDAFLEAQKAASKKEEEGVESIGGVETVEEAEPAPKKGTARRKTSEATQETPKKTKETTKKKDTKKKRPTIR